MTLTKEKTRILQNKAVQIRQGTFRMDVKEDLTTLKEAKCYTLFLMSPQFSHFVRNASPELNSFLSSAPTWCWENYIMIFHIWSFFMFQHFYQDSKARHADLTSVRTSNLNELDLLLCIKHYKYTLHTLNP